ncbi:MAG: hypothetical protein KC656_32040, partial [Myxococcales bacterium]|nr:hypothetical protein [Myxococcales bacterium]
MLQTLSNDLAAAVAAIAPHLLAHVTRRGVSTLFAVDAHHAIGSAHALRHLGRIEVQGQPTDAEVVGVARGL